MISLPLSPSPSREGWQGAGTQDVGCATLANGRPTQACALWRRRGALTQTHFLAQTRGLRRKNKDDDREPLLDGPDAPLKNAIDIDALGPRASKHKVHIVDRSANGRPPSSATKWTNWWSTCVPGNRRQSTCQSPTHGRHMRQPTDHRAVPVAAAVRSASSRASKRGTPTPRRKRDRTSRKGARRRRGGRRQQYRRTR